MELRMGPIEEPELGKIWLSHKVFSNSDVFYFEVISARTGKKLIYLSKDPIRMHFYKLSDEEVSNLFQMNVPLIETHDLLLETFLELTIIFFSLITYSSEVSKTRKKDVVRLAAHIYNNEILPHAESAEKHKTIKYSIPFKGIDQRKK